MQKSEIIKEYLTSNQVSTIENIRSFITNLWALGDVLHPFYTLHGVQHSQAVEGIVGDILAVEHKHPSETLKPEQLFYLLASSWLHDVGMVIPPSEIEKQDSLTKKIPLQDLIRNTHHERSYEYIINNANKLGLKQAEEEIIGLICKAHGEETITSLSSNYPDIQFLAAILCAADLLDISNTRAPAQLIDLKWIDMDETSRWHWIKHYCVTKMEPYHDESKDGINLLMLKYQLVITVSSPKFEIPFFEKICDPIRRTLDRDHINLILSKKQLSVIVDGFRYTPLYIPKVFPDGTDLDHRLLAVLTPNIPIPPEIIKYLDTLQNKLSYPAGELLRKQCHQLICTTSEPLAITPKVKDKLNHYLNILANASELSDITIAHTQFTDAMHECLALLEQLNTSQSIIRQVSTEWQTLANTSWRLMNISLGDEATKLNHLTHLLLGNIPEARAIGAWFARDPNLLLRRKAISILADFAERGLVDCYSEMILASRDSDAAIRMSATKALAYLPGPQTLNRLAEILGNDVNEEVRQAAKNSMEKLIKRSSKSHIEFTGRKVLILDESPYVALPLVDALTLRGIEPIVTTKLEKLEDILKNSNWIPDVVICELKDINLQTSDSSTYDLPGLVLAKFVRSKLGEGIPIIGTSVINSEDIIVQLHEIHALYIQKPVTVDKFVYTIESLFPNI